MAGSQLKQLKATLKANGLIGQTNIKKKNKKSKAPSETRRNDKDKILTNIRDQFNQFDQRFNRTKHDVTTILGGKFVKVGSKQHNDSTKSKSNIEKSLKMEYEYQKKHKGKNGGVIDRRFGESNKNMTAEEKMLERFTRERQAASKKGNLFSLGSDDDEDDDGFSLTHGGKSLSFADGFDEGDLGLSDKKYIDEDQLMPEDEPVRRKSKNEVMKEIIAKSKFYKQQRKMEFEKVQDEIVDLDEDFADVMNAFNEVKQEAPQFSKKTEVDLAYDNKVRELNYEKRSVPADRTKTEEELQKEHEERMKKLESDRLKRMNGLEVEDRDAEADDLDDDFWAGSGEEEEEENGFSIEDSDVEKSKDGETSSDEEGVVYGGRPSVPKKLAVVMPTTHEEFLSALGLIKEENQANYISKIVETYKPNLAAGNKEKMNDFVGILFEHLLYLANAKEVNQSLVEKFTKILKRLAETYNESLVETIRNHIQKVQSRIIASNLAKEDLFFFSIIGYLFSTSDHYHLIVTPVLILMNEFLSGLHYSKDLSLKQLGQGIFVSDILLNYQKFAKRYIPEAVCFLQKTLLLLVPEPIKISEKSKISAVSNIINSNTNIKKDVKFETYRESDISISMSSIFANDDNEYKLKLIIKSLHLVDKMTSLWKDKSALIEVIEPFIVILKHLIKYYALVLPTSVNILTKLTKIHANAVIDRKPLALQTHKKLGIATFAPKFEENFNPDKKSYDVNRERQELNKIKNQIKKEKKSTLKDIRKQTKFEAREQIKEKISMYDTYHKKMANIVNSISTIEGAEKNQYEREKQKRKNAK